MCIMLCTTRSTLMCRVIIWACAVDPILNSVFFYHYFSLFSIPGGPGARGEGEIGRRGGGGGRGEKVKKGGRGGAKMIGAEGYSP